VHRSTLDDLEVGLKHSFMVGVVHPVVNDLLPEVSRQEVKVIFDEFTRVGLVATWEQGGKKWGYFNGIEKPGSTSDPYALLKNRMAVPGCLFHERGTVHKIQSSAAEKQ
jgi:hypothetical protein